jgi:hypothetical protein
MEISMLDTDTSTYEFLKLKTKLYHSDHPTTLDQKLRRRHSSLGRLAGHFCPLVILY